MKACENDVFMAKAPEPGAPLKGANSFTENQAKDRAIAAGFTSVRRSSRTATASGAAAP